MHGWQITYQWFWCNEIVSIVCLCRFGAIKSLLENLVLILLWTLQGVLVEYDVKHIYNLPSQWWRIVILVSNYLLFHLCIWITLTWIPECFFDLFQILAVGFTAWQLKEEISEYMHSKKNHSVMSFIFAVINFVAMSVIKSSIYLCSLTWCLESCERGELVCYGVLIDSCPRTSHYYNGVLIYSSGRSELVCNSLLIDSCGRSKLVCNGVLIDSCVAEVCWMTAVGVVNYSL